MEGPLHKKTPKNQKNNKTLILAIPFQEAYFLTIKGQNAHL